MAGLFAAATDAVYSPPPMTDGLVFVFEWLGLVCQSIGSFKRRARLFASQPRIPSPAPDQKDAYIPERTAGKTQLTSTKADSGQGRESILVSFYQIYPPCFTTTALPVQNMGGAKGYAEYHENSLYTTLKSTPRIPCPSSELSSCRLRLSQIGPDLARASLFWAASAIVATE